MLTTRKEKEDERIFPDAKKDHKEVKGILGQLKRDQRE
jgi:hypothetical protein